jgi:hypothetical protein
MCFRERKEVAYCEDGYDVKLKNLIILVLFRLESILIFYFNNFNDDYDV